MRSSPAVIASPDFPGDLPLKRPRSTPMSKREFQEVPRVDFTWKSWIGTPRGHDGLSLGATWSIHTERIMAESRASRALTAVNDFWRPKNCHCHCSPLFVHCIGSNCFVSGASQRRCPEEPWIGSTRWRDSNLHSGQAINEASQQSHDSKPLIVLCCRQRGCSRLPLAGL